MKPVYERQNLIITEFPVEDVITTSGESPHNPGQDTPVVSMLSVAENEYLDITKADAPGSWY